jgi:muconate cycloisomerase
VAVHEWLGGCVVDRLTLNAWIGVVSPAEAAEQAEQWSRRGFRSCKVKVGGNLDADFQRVSEVRRAVGSTMQVRVDANAGYDVEGAIKLGRALEPLQVQWLEQPVAAKDLPGMAAVRRSIGIPVMADEAVTDHSSLVAVLRADCADIVKLKVMKQGGLLHCRRMVETAAAAGKKVVIGHGFGLGINTAAELMLASTSDAVVDGLECVGPLKTADDVVQRKFDFGSGSVGVPLGPGLGVELDEEKLEKYRLAES